MIGKGAAKNDFVFGGLLVVFRGNMKSCSFFGHRDTLQTEELKQKVKETVEHLIVEEGVDTFLFGSRSNFDELCHIVVTGLKEKYPYIRRIAYLCKHESGCLVGAGASLRQNIKDLTGRDVYVGEYEEIKKSDRINSAGRASYVERNQWMVSNSDYAIFYLNENYCAKNSGTVKTFLYAQSLRNVIISLS